MTQSRTNSEFDQGYTHALNKLRDRLTAENKKPSAAVKQVLEHIQDLLGRCGQCGSWVYSDGSCLTCEMSKAQTK